MTMTKFPTVELAAGVHQLISHVNGVIAKHWEDRGYTYAKPDTVEVESIGSSFARIVTLENRKDGSTSRGSVYCFVAMKDGNTKGLGAFKEGDLFKAAGWKAPARGIRGNVFTDLTRCTAYGMEYNK